MNTGTSNKTLISIAMTAVESSQLSAIGYDPGSQTLQVDFTQNPDKIYQYQGVSPVTFDALQAAESKGSFVHKNVKDKFAFARFDRASGDLQKYWSPDPEGSEKTTDAAQQAA